MSPYNALIGSVYADKRWEGVQHRWPLWAAGRQTIPTVLADEVGLRIAAPLPQSLKSNHHDSCDGRMKGWG